MTCACGRITLSLRLCRVDLVLGVRVSAIVLTPPPPYQ